MANTTNMRMTLKRLTTSGVRHPIAEANKRLLQSESSDSSKQKLTSAVGVIEHPNRGAGRPVENIDRFEVSVVEKMIQG